MFQKILFTCVFLCSIATVTAQNDADLKLAQEYIDSAAANKSNANFNKAIKFGHKALDIGLNRGIDSIISKSYIEIAETYYYKRNLDSSFFFTQKTLDQISGNEISPTSSMTYRLLGIISYYRGNYKKGMEYTKTSIDITEKVYGKKHPKSIDMNADYAFLLANFGKYTLALHKLNKALEYSLEIGKEKGKKYQLISKCYFGLANVHMKMKNILEANKILEKALEIDKKELGENHDRIAGAYINLGNNYSRLNNYKRALEYYSSAEKIYLTNPSTFKFLLGDTYINIGNTYSKKKEFHKALKYFKKAVPILKENFGEKNQNTAKAYSDIALIYKRLNQPNKAIEKYNKAINIFLALDKSDSRLVKTYNNLALAYLAKNENENALHYLSKSQDIIKINSIENDPSQLDIYISYGFIYSETEIYDKSVEYYKKAEQIAALISKENYLEKIPVYLGISKAYLKSNKIAESKKYLDKSFYLIHDQIKQDMVQADQVSNLINSIEYYTVRSDYYSKLNNNIYSDSIKINNEKTLALIDHWQKNISNSNDKQVKTTLFLKNYENSIEHLISRKKEEELIQTFEIAEKTKSRILAENFRATNAQHFGKVPDSLVNKEYDLKVDITYYDKKFYEAKRKPKKSMTV